jgi:hypothetical protein
MNQKTIIYIILSAILLYLYSKRGGVILFAAFVVVVVGTLFAGAGTGSIEGLSLGGGKGDKECAKLGFTAPKIDKNDIKGSLDKILKNFKKVVEKYADVGEGGINIGKSNKEIEAIFENDSAKNILTKWKEDSNNNLSELFNNSFMLFEPYIFRPSEEKQQKYIDEKLPALVKNKEEVKKTINGGNRAVKMFEDVKKLDETGKLDKKVKTILDVTICSFKQTVLIWKSVVKAMGGEDGVDGGDGGDDAGDDEEKLKKKKKKSKSTKKKSKKDDEDDEDE